MSAGKLLLHPAPDAEPPPTISRVTKALSELGFIGADLPSLGPNHFLAGERFLQLVSFLGCSPHVNLLAPADGRDNFSYLALLGPWDSPHLIHGSNTRPPGCPVCKKRNRNWRPLAAAWEVDRRLGDWTCDACGARSPPWEWNWRQQAGVGRFFVLVNDIFPSEAVPSNELLNRLQGETGTSWKHFYVQGPSSPG